MNEHVSGTQLLADFIELPDAIATLANHYGITVKEAVTLILGANESACQMVRTGRPVPDLARSPVREAQD
jgi:hypothetical protein